ncbi:hypothetical protein ACQ4PT_057092 [Festuca glaucescens]
MNSRSVLSQILRRYHQPTPTSSPRRLIDLFSPVRGFSSLPRVRPAVRPSSTAASLLHGQYYGTTARRSSVLRWYHDPRKVAAATAITLSATAMAACSRYDREIVPCTNRSHRVVYSHQEERDLGDADFAVDKARFVILDPSDPRSIRACLVTERIVHAAHRGLGLYDSNDAPMLRVTRKWGAATAPQPHTSHLRALNWEVFVAENGTPDVVIAPGGKILVSTGFLDHFSDEELAAALAHEVGHVIARHTADISGWFPVFLERIISRRMEIEADYIGILLLGAAGFHPQWALAELAKREKFARFSVLEKLLSYHPKTEKRLQLLSQAKTMKEALELYREVTAMDKVTDRYFPYHVKV